MKKLAIFFLFTLLTVLGAVAQKPVYESAMKRFGYKNDNGTWRIMPQ